MANERLKARQIPIGKPIDWDVFDKNDHLVIRKGMIVRSRRQVMRLIEHGALRKSGLNKQNDAVEQINDVLSPFGDILQLAKLTAAIFHKVTHVVPDDALRVPQKIIGLCREIEKLCDYDLDATLGSIHLWHAIPYTISHPLNTAILCFVIANKLGWEAERKVLLMAAALTANVGMFDLQRVLQAQESEITKAQKDEINQHPLRSAVLLKRWGVSNKLWLETVLQHHERLDGKGYPRKLSADRFITEARLVGIADRYHALLTPRKDRQAMPPTEALSTLFRERGMEVDGDLAREFVAELGIYPPGSTVRLKNGELAVVTRRGHDQNKPEVKSFVNDRGVRYAHLKERDPSHGFYEIVGIAKPIAKFTPDLKDLWGYQLKREP